MKKHFLFFLSTALAVIAIGLACQRAINPPITQPKPVILTSASVQGRVLDENKLPVSGATVTAGVSATTTDVNGNFKINQVQLDQDKGFIKVDKPGYFLGSRTFVVNTSGSNKVEIELIKKVTAGTFVVGAGGNITVPSGGTVTFPANAVVNTATNSAYTGSVEVSAFHLDPTAANFAAIMPGDLRGVTTQNQETGLQSFGMLAVELTGTGGEKLQLAAGKTATLNFPIPTVLQAQAPATIPLWYFDESKGMWIEQGSATKQGSQYVGTVSHFSFWNVDAPFPVIDFSAVLKDQQGNALKGAWVVMKTQLDKTSISGSGYTDSSGKVMGKIPANKALEMSIYNSCGALLATQNVGPFINTADLGTLTITNALPATLIISGTAVNCNNLPVSNGYVNILIDGGNQRAAINSNGSFSINITRCSNVTTTASLIAVDVAGGVQGPISEITVSSGAVSAGQLTACGASSAEYINFTIGDSAYTITVPPDSIYTSRSFSTHQILASTAFSNPARKSLNMKYIGDTTVGSHMISYLEFNIRNTVYYSADTMYTQITEYGARNQFIAGTFTGNLSDSAGTIVVPVNCSYRVRRRQ